MPFTAQPDFSKILPLLRMPSPLAPVAGTAAPDDGTNAGTPDAPAPMPNYLQPIGAPAPTPPPQSPQTQSDAQELQRLTQTGSGVHQFQQKHHILGAIARIGDVAGSILFPGATAMVPGTTLHHNLLENQAQGRLTQDVANDERNAQAGADQARAQEAQALTGEANARTNAIEHPQPKPTPAPKQIPPKAIEYLGPDGKPVWGAFHDGNVYDSNGAIVPNAHVYTRPPVEHAKTTFEEWLSDPATFEKFLRAEATAKGAGKPHATGMGLYTVVRAIDSAARVDPRLESLIPMLLESQGIQVPAGIDFSKPPVGQPENGQGVPIGLSDPGAPTSSRRTAGQQAADILPTINEAENQIRGMAGKIGPLQGRLNDIYVGSFGANDPQYAGLKAQLELLAGAFNKAHLNTELGYKDFGQLLRTKQSIPDLLATLDQVRELAQRYKSAGEGKPVGQHRGAASEWQPPEGAPSAQGVANGKYLYQDGHPVAKAENGKWVQP